jgi:hypothetical protein
VRPADWSAIERDSDPIPGEPTTIRELANHLLGVAEAIRNENSRMAALDAGEIWDSEAAVTFAEMQEKLPPDLELAATRYEGAAQALFTWESALSSAQAAADAALLVAQEAQADIEAADAGIEQMEQWETDAQRIADQANEAAEPGAVSVEPEPWTGANHYALREAAYERLDGAKADLETAEGDRDDAADTAESALDDASHDDLENPGFWESVLLAAADVLSIAAAVLGVLSIFFPVLAPFALAIGLLSMGLNFYLAATGAKGWKDFIIDAIGLATFGIGRGATLIGRAATARPFARAADAAFDSGTDALGAMNRAQAGQRALAARPNMTGVRVPNPNGGRPLTGAAARSRLNAQYNQAQNAARTNYQRATGDYYQQLGRYDDIRHPPETPWTGWSDVGPYAASNARAAVNPWRANGTFGKIGVTAEIGIGTGIAGYQTYDAGSNIFGGGDYYPWNR